jgi:hypothetical protein
MMSAGAPNDRVQTGPTKSCFFVLEPVHPAFAGADAAGFKEPVGNRDAIL